MKHQFIDTKKLVQAIEEIRAERDKLKKQQAALRVQESRYRKLLKQAGLEQYGEPKIL